MKLLYPECSWLFNKESKNSWSVPLLKYFELHSMDAKNLLFGEGGWVYVKVGDNFIKSIFILDMLKYYEELNIKIDNNLEKWYTLYVVSSTISKG